MSVDYRVTHRDDGSVVDPFAVKSLVIQTSDEPGGPIALIGYAGLAELWDRMPMGRWRQGHRLETNHEGLLRSGRSAATFPHAMDFLRN